MSGTHFKLEVQPQIPKELCRLEELANNLIYSWDRQVRGLFFRLDKDLWESTGHNPSRFLKYISQEKLEKAAKDPAYIQDYKKTLSSYDFYLETVNPIGTEGYLNPEQDLISYSCAEFGVHESLPIYSGGLGILAGDHCKTASDLGLPFIGIGLLYRRGYFGQTIDGEGNQVVQHRDVVRQRADAAGSHGEGEVAVDVRRDRHQRCGVRLELLRGPDHKVEGIDIGVAVIERLAEQTEHHFRVSAGRGKLTWRRARNCGRRESLAPGLTAGPLAMRSSASARASVLRRSASLALSARKPSSCGL